MTFLAIALFVIGGFLTLGLVGFGILIEQEPEPRVKLAILVLALVDVVIIVVQVAAGIELIRHA
jgi:uncharacterized membrane protein